VAAAHGATAFGIDIDEDAVAAAEANARLNGLLEGCRFTAEPLESVTEHFELVVANLEPLTQLELSSELFSRVAPGKLLVLTGFLEEHVELVLEAYLAQGFTVEERTQDGDYCLLQLLAPSNAPTEGTA
jgi:ribosomal protein L11 methyltransferase